MDETVFEELKRYVAFGPGDEAALRAVHPLAAPRFVAMAELFYARILGHDGARAALEGGESTVGQLKVTLVQWFDELLSGPWDDDYFERRCRIGRVHVRINLPQHYMFGAMNVVREQLSLLLDEPRGDAPEWLRAARLAVGKVLDLELAVMLHTYREEMLSQQARQERLATFGQLVGSIGHELRNPLGVMETSLFILKGRVGDDERACKHIQRISEQLGIANHIITDLLDLIRDRPLAREPMVLAAVVGGAVEAVTRPDAVALEVAGFEDLPTMEGDPAQLRQVFVNLVENAVHAASPEGLVRVLARVAQGRVEVVVEDSGTGVDASVRRRLFEPLITTKQAGIGLGLALVKRIVERHGGTIGYEPDPQAARGARFVIRFP